MSRIFTCMKPRVVVHNIYW